jgi:hypothetical protein
LVFKFAQIDAPLVIIVVVVQADNHLFEARYVLLQFAVFDALVDEHRFGWGGHFGISWHILTA